VDKRATRHVNALLDRLERRVADGFGPGVAVMTQLDGRGRPSIIHLSLRAADGAVFSGKYMIGQPRPGNPVPLAPEPANWPDPGPDEFLRALRAARPMTMQLAPADAPPVFRAQFTTYDLPGQLWPSRLALGAFTGGTWETRADPDRPGLIALRHVRGTPDGGYRREWTYWLDPARDDLPVESLETNKAGEGFVNRTRRVYSDFKRTAAGQWYPSRIGEWITLGDTPDEPPPPPRESVVEVYPGHPVDREWFGDLAERLNRAAPTAAPATRRQ
jgi:hypothetical protein